MSQFPLPSQPQSETQSSQWKQPSQPLSPQQSMYEQSQHHQQQPLPMQTPPQPPKRRLKKRWLVIVAIVLIVVIGIAAVSHSGSSSSPAAAPTVDTTATAKLNATSTANADATSIANADATNIANAPATSTANAYATSIANAVATNIANAPATSTAEALTPTTPPATPTPATDIGTTQDIGTWVVTLNKVYRASSGPWISPKVGDLFVVVDVTVINEAGTSELISSELSFVFQDETGQAYQEALTGIGVSPDGTVPAGGKLRGEISYEVPSSLHNFTLEFQDNLYNGNTGTWSFSV